MAFTSPQAVTLVVLAVATGLASVVDLRHRRIPNAFPAATAVIGVALAGTGATGITITSSLLGCALGLALMIPGHVFGGTGAGDVKMFAAVGTVLGVPRTFEAFLFVAISGGVLALAVACVRGRLVRTLALTARLCGSPRQARADVASAGENNRFPYGPAIAVGCVLATLRWTVW